MKKIKVLFIVCGLFFIFILSGCDESDVELKENEVQVLKSEAHFTGSHYEDVVNELEAWGFTNIQIVPVYDIVFNITQPGTIKEIIINDSNSYTIGDIFNNNVLIVIKYSMPDDEDPEKQTYTITWKNDDGSTIKTDEILWGNLPEYTEAVPTKEKTLEVTYTFSGWTPDITEVTEDQVYTAVYQESINTYSVTWKNEDGTVLEIDNDLVIGTMPSFDGAVPTKAETAEFSYDFKGWNQEVTAVTQDQEYIAMFTENKKTYTITWTDPDGVILEIDENVSYGTIPTYNGEIPVKANTLEFSYEFVGWIPIIESVTKDQVYQAIITKTINRYTISVDPAGGELENTEIHFEYGTTFYSLAEPRKLGFIFTGWLLDGETLTFPYTIVDHIQITAVYREMEAHELLWDYYTEVTENPNIIANHEESYVEILSDDSSGRAIYNKDGLYGLYYDMDGYEFIVVIDLINSMIYYTDQYDWYYERDFLFRTYEGNVSMDDYLFIEDLFTGALDGLTDGIFVTIAETYNKTIDFSEFNDDWSYLLSLAEDHYKTYEMLVMDSIRLTMYHYELSFTGNYVYYYVYIQNNSDEIITYLKINLEFVMHAIYGTSTTYTTNMYWSGTLYPGELTSDYVIIETSNLFTKTVDGSSTNYTGLYTDIYLDILNVMY